MNKVLSIMGLVAVLLFVSVQYAEAQEITLEGENKDHGIFIAIQGNSNIMMWDTIDGYSEHFDSKLKTYKSGGFSLKNPESGIAVWAHPINDAQYKLVILTSEEVERMTGSLIEEIEHIEPTGNQSIEPKSSVGADITKYDIPTVSRDDGKTDFKITVKTDRIHTEYLDKEFVFNASILNTRNGEPLEGAKVTAEIVRDDFLLMKASVVTEKGGKVNIDFGYLTYPLLYPGFCYDLNVTTEYGNHTSTWTDDLEIGYLGTYWHPNTSWIGQEAYSYYPEEYKTEPRIELRSDTTCND